ncbi:MAG: uncharacterized protein QOD77_1004 [Thermoplasmata archaeon]|jgi:uncharacterized protein (UPF0147 family)|nr:uncharacterized protein [Thermoplasmata archaeon]
MASRIQNINTGLEMLMEDTSVPRNIRRSAEQIKLLLSENDKPLDVRKAKAINTLDDMANDPNIPLHGRTLVWNIMSQLETLA